MAVYIFDYKDYWVDLDIPATINFTLNRITEGDLLDLDNYITNMSIPDDQTLLILWGLGARIPINDSSMDKLNALYNRINNPMVLFSNGNYQSCILEFPVCQINFFRYVSKRCFVKFNSPDIVTDRSLNLNKQKKFMFASTKDLLSRRYLLQTIINGNFTDQGYLSYKCIISNLEIEKYKTHDLNHIMELCKSIETILPIKGFDDSIEFHFIPFNVYDDCYLSIITDTYFLSDMVYFSEKIFNAMLYKHFFIYLGPAHSLKHLRTLGFKTFSHIIDESYDDIEDPAQRLFAVCKSTREFLCRPRDEIQRLYFENASIITHNRDLILATEINDTIVSTMKRAIDIKRQ